MDNTIRKAIHDRRWQIRPLRCSPAGLFARMFERMFAQPGLGEIRKCLLTFRPDSTES